MLLSKWTPELLTRGLAVLSDTQKELFLFHIDYQASYNREPSAATYKKFGFHFLDEYNAEIENCMRLVKGSFGAMGLTSCRDLEFDVPDSTSDGRRIMKPKKRASTAEGRKAKTKTAV